MSGRQDSIALLLMPPAGFVMALSVAGLFSLSGWFPELSSHFYAQYLIVLSVFAICFALLKKRKFAIFLIPFVLICLVKIVPLYIPAGQKTQAYAGKFSVMTINVNTANRNIDAVVERVRQYKPDVISFEEVDKWWVEQLTAALSSEYPSSEAEPRNDNFGIAEFSKLPCLQHKVIWIKVPAVAVPAIWAEYSLEGKTVSVVALHTLPPVYPQYSWVRNFEFAELAKMRSQFDENLIIAGDLNCTPFSQEFDRFLQGTGTKNTMNGFGLQCSWPTVVPYCPLLLIPIDHILTSPNIVCLRREVGQAMGSDHFPVFAELAIQN